MFDDFCAFERTLSVNVSLPSGRNESLKVPELSTVGDLQVLAQESFGQKFLRLVTSKNVALTNPKDSLQAAGIQEGEHLTAFVQQVPQGAISFLRVRLPPFWLMGQS